MSVVASGLCWSLCGDFQEAIISRSHPESTGSTGWVYSWQKTLNNCQKHGKTPYILTSWTLSLACTVPSFFIRDNFQSARKTVWEELDQRLQCFTLSSYCWNQRTILGLVVWNFRSSHKIYPPKPKLRIAWRRSEEAWAGLTQAFLVSTSYALGVVKAAECGVFTPDDCAVVWGSGIPAPRGLAAGGNGCCGQYQHQQHLVSERWQLVASSEFLPAGLTFNLGKKNAFWRACFGRLL